MQHVVNAPKRGWELKPDRKWDCKTKDFGFKIVGKADETYTSCLEIKKNTTGGSVFCKYSQSCV